MILRYWGNVWARALRDTWRLIVDRQLVKLALGLVVVAGSYWLFMWLEGPEAFFEEARLPLSFAIMGALSFVVVLLVHVGRTPAVLHAEGANRIAELVDRRKREAAIDRLAALRADGHRLLTVKARAVTSDDSLTVWIAEYQQWKRDVAAHLENEFSNALRDSFLHVGSIPETSHSDAFNGAHNVALRGLAYRMSLMERTILSYALPVPSSPHTELYPS